MAYAEYAPHPGLGQYVRCVWTRDVDAAEDDSHAVMPDGCIDLLFDQPSGRLRVIGTMTRAAWTRGCGWKRFLGIRFEPGGAAALLRERADRLTDVAPRCEEVLGRAGRELEAQLRDGPRRHVLESFLLRRARDAPDVERRVAWATSTLGRDPAVPIAALARELGVSRQYARRLFLQHTGVGPKAFARIARLERVVGGLWRGTPLAAAAAAAGYVDQAHMTKDFRDLVGVTPGAFGFPSVQDARAAAR